MKKIILLCLLLPFVSKVYAKDCKIEVGVADNMFFTPQALEVSASKCKTITIALKHTGQLPRAAMGHNWVLTTTADAMPVAQAGWAAGLKNQYLPVDDKRIIAGTDIIGGGETTSVTFDSSVLTVGGDYTFFCSFIGHVAMMKGKFTVTK